MELNQRNVDVKKLINILDQKLSVIDIGCRWGFQEHWNQLGSAVQLIGMDADETEIVKLNKNNNEEQFIPKLLGAIKGLRNFNLTQDPACNSLYPPDVELIHCRPMLAVTSLVSQKTVEITLLDDWIKEKGITKVDFMKLDVQGAELDVLQGAEKTLDSVRMLEVEVQFNPIYKGVPLFGDVDQFLRNHGFTLWRIANFTHYSNSDISPRTYSEETIYYDNQSVIFNGKPGQLSWADAFYVREETAYEHPREWKTALIDGCIASVLGFEDLSISSINEAIKNCPIDIKEKILESFNQFSSEIVRRINMTVSCSDCDSIIKIPHAGELADGPDGYIQLMHNGVKIVKDCYCGAWMTEIIRILKGHHEPQEEKAFNEILKYIRPNGTMLELGSHWSYYSMWFQQQIPGAQNYMIEPDAVYFEIGKNNFALNNMNGKFINAAIGKVSKDVIPFHCEGDNVSRNIPVISVDDFVENENIKNIEVLLCDIQGNELEMLQGAERSLEQGIIRFIIISTHHHSISNDLFTHQKVRDLLIKFDANIIAEHTIYESFSGDGLIVASLKPEDRNLLKIDLSKNIPANSLYGELDNDLSNLLAENGYLKSELKQSRIENFQTQQQLSSLYNSWSYKLAKPLRMAGRILSSLKK